MLNTLIVEDNAAYRQSLNQLLAGRFPSMQIAEAEDGEEALRHALSRRFDLIFMDIRLPRGNGLDLTKTIKSIFVDSVICVITSYDILEYREAAFRNGADHFMVKGESTEAEIVGLIESFLRTRFITLIIVNDMLYRKQLNMLLSIHWPVMIVEEAMDAATGLGHAATLKPEPGAARTGVAGRQCRRTGPGDPGREPASDTYRHDRRRVAGLPANGHRLRRGLLRSLDADGPYRACGHREIHTVGTNTSLIRRWPTVNFLL